MSLENQKSYVGKLVVERHADFKRDAKDLSDAELAEKYGLRERTATNWRLKLFGPRPAKQGTS